jgi:hypothetical protein
MVCESIIDRYWGMRETANHAGTISYFPVIAVSRGCYPFGKLWTRVQLLGILADMKRGDQ